MPPTRPGVPRWLWYAVTGRLPPRYREWVLYDLSCRTWPLRHMARLLVPLVPIGVALGFLLPGPLSLRVTAIVMGSVIGLLFTVAFLFDSTENRARRYGYPPGALDEARQSRKAARDLAKAVKEFNRTHRFRR